MTSERTVPYNESESITHKKAEHHDSGSIQGSHSMLLTECERERDSMCACAHLMHVYVYDMLLKDIGG